MALPEERKIQQDINKLLEERNILDQKIAERGKAHHTQLKQRAKLTEKIKASEEEIAELAKERIKTSTKIDSTIKTTEKRY